MIIKTNKDEFNNYLTDASNFKNENCDALYIPANIAEIKKLFNELYSRNIPISISGTGTGLCGGRVPESGVIVSTEKLNEIIQFSSDDYSIIVEAGVILSDLQSYCNERGFFYPPDPTETNCSIGGTIATNASGAKSFKYGQTRNWISALEVILANGKAVNLKRGLNFCDNGKLKLLTDDNSEIVIDIPEIKMPAVKNTAGYFVSQNMDAIDLFIGSEGTLGLITKAELKLCKLPEKLLSFVLFFSSFDTLMSFVSEVKSKSSEPKDTGSVISVRAIEFFDNNAIEFVGDTNKTDKFGIWIEQEVLAEEEEIIMEKWFNLLTRYSISDEDTWFAFDEKEQNKLKEFRHIIPLKVNDFISKNNLRKVGTDIAVASGNFSELYYYCTNKCKENQINYVSYGHIGNDHLHLNMLPEDGIQFDTAKALYYNFCEKAVQLGGTVSAEHGIGKLKKNYLKLMFTEEQILKMKKVKQTLDPNEILGKGNIF